MTRIREEGLELIEGCLVVPRRSSALVWAETIAEWVAPGLWRVLAGYEVKNALRRGAATWYQLPQTPPAEPLSAFIDLKAEFVDNRDVPGRTASGSVVARATYAGGVAPRGTCTSAPCTSGPGLNVSGARRVVRPARRRLVGPRCPANQLRRCSHAWRRSSLRT